MALSFTTSLRCSQVHQSSFTSSPPCSPHLTCSITLVLSLLSLHLLHYALFHPDLPIMVYSVCLSIYLFVIHAVTVGHSFIHFIMYSVNLSPTPPPTHYSSNQSFHHSIPVILSITPLLNLLIIVILSFIRSFFHLLLHSILHFCVILSFTPSLSPSPHSSCIQSIYPPLHQSHITQVIIHSVIPSLHPCPCHSITLAPNLSLLRAIYY